MKNQNGYTKGPWRVGWDSGEGYATDREGAWIRTEAEVIIFGGVDDWGIKKGVRTEANARLIAAAPELLEGCKDALRVLEAMGHKDTVCAIDLRTLISKAEGK